MDFNTKRTWGPTPNYERVKGYAPPTKEFILIAGPCSVESPEQIQEIAKVVAGEGATHLRGGIFRAGTYPGQNFGVVIPHLLDAYADAAQKNGLRNIIEVLDIREALRLKHYCTSFQVGARQMQNYPLLRHLAGYGREVFLKRNTGATMDEFLGAAEHILVGGAEAGVAAKPILIERGGSTHMNHVRWDLSISIIPAIKRISAIPVICDPSHGTGRWDLVDPMALAGVAAGADGLLVEVHTNPRESLSDADQALSPEQFKQLAARVRAIRKALE